MYQHTNKLILETSPYLLQHAHNPVEWYPWCDEALQKAKSEDRPILVSIGYAACHWCHVMERESFEDEKVAAFMNEHFINIKIDREERPDLDHIYMDAVQTMTGSGGWPLNVFLTPDAKPFYGGTYFPPVRIHNRMSWMDTLEAVVNAYKEKRDQVAEQAGKLVEHLIKSNSFGIGSSREESTNFASADQHNAFEALMNSSDKEWGGFGNAPKFPQTFSIRFLLRYHYYFENSKALVQARLSLDKMIAGGLYDQVGGGFSRYSTDTEWLVPHFEKMLYDNALLVEVLSEAYQLTGKLRYKEVIGETISFVEREMMHRDHGFYSAIDADSEGEEGKFYVWERREVEDLLGQDAEIFCDYFDISLNGNWEGKNILNIRIPTDEYASRKDIDPDRLNEIIRGGKKILFRKRETRVRPALDDKIILGWNALMNTSLSKAFAATGDPRYRKLALTNMEFLLNHFSSGKGNRFFHTWKDGIAKIPAFLDDYACLIRALTNLYEITGEGDWLIKARDLMIQSLKLFSDNEKGYLSYTATDQKDVIIRKKEIYDGALPSGNSIMAGNLCQLSVLFDNPAWMKWGQSLVESLGQVLVRYPSSFSNWNCLLLDLSAGYVDLAITGKSPGDLHEQLLAVFIPNRILTISSVENEHIAPLMGKRPGEKTKVFVCKDKTCLPPVEDFDSVLAQIHS